MASDANVVENINITVIEEEQNNITYEIVGNIQPDYEILLSQSKIYTINKYITLNYITTINVGVGVELKKERWNNSNSVYQDNTNRNKRLTITISVEALQQNNSGRITLYQ